MKKLLLIVLVLFTCTAYAQNSNRLGSRTPYYNAINKWVVVDAENSQFIGFIYIDLYAGVTLRHALYGLTVGDDGKLSMKPQNENAMISVRLNTQNSIDVIILSDEQLSELGLPTEPEWLKHYKPEKESVNDLVRLGRVYNSIGLCNKALIPLLKAYKIASRSPGLAFELAFAYNHLGLYSKASKIALRALSHDPKNPYHYRELVLAYVGLGEFELAETYFEKGLKIIEDETIRGEMEFNIAYGYFIVRNKAKFDYWSKQAMMHVDYAEDLLKEMKDDWNTDPKTY